MARWGSELTLHLPASVCLTHIRVGFRGASAIGEKMAVAQRFPCVASCRHQQAQGQAAAEGPAEEVEGGASQAELGPREGKGRKFQQVEGHKSPAQGTACQQLKNLHAAKTFRQTGTPSFQALSQRAPPCWGSVLPPGSTEGVWSQSSTAFHRVSEFVRKALAYAFDSQNHPKV